jgi:transcriptional regulator with XRE-family HTH domain
MAEERRPPVGERLRAWREAHGLSQSQLGRHLGVESFTVSRWERGAQQPPERMLDLALRELERQLQDS